MNLILYIALLFLDILAILDVILIVDVLFGARLAINVKKLFVTCLIFVVTQFLIEILWSDVNSLIVTLVEFLFMAVSIFCFSQKKRFKTSLLTIPSVFVYIQWDHIGDLIEKLFRLDKYIIYYSKFEITPATFINDLSLLLLLVLLRRKFLKMNYIMKLTLGELVFLCVFSFFSVAITAVLDMLESVFNNNLYNMIWVVFVLFLNVLVVYAIMHRHKASYYKELSNSYKQQFNSEYNYFKEYKNKDKDMMKFRHDWNNHMIVIQDLFDQGRFDEAKKYFNSFPVPKKGKIRRVITGNETVDTIFAAKTDLFEKNSVELRFEGNLVRLESMEPVDICILFSNLIDNALEALSKVQNQKSFEIKVTESHNIIMIVLTNDMIGELNKDGEVIITSKKDVINHGIGLQNIKNIINKYNGEYKIEVIDKKFSIKIILPM